MARKFVYSFGAGQAEGREDMRDLLGGKGAGLMEMTHAGIPVPPGFTLTTEVCNLYRQSGQLPREAVRQIEEHLELLEQRTGKKLGRGPQPLLVSVRSGARISMPGMMDTILNLGMNDHCTAPLAKSTDGRFARDAYRRLLQMYGNVVLGIDSAQFEAVLSRHKKSKKARLDSELDEATLRAVVRDYQALIKKLTRSPFPQDPKQQLLGAIEAVFRSWMNDRACHYRKLNDIPDDIGTACTVQAMVFGNRGQSSATGVGFTRNPATGDQEFYGEFLMNAQGEDVVAGIRTPRPLSELQAELPEAYEKLHTIVSRLERHYGEMQDFEFTIEEGELFMLQTRTGKRTGMAAVKIATDMVNEGLITREEALIRVEPVQLLQLLHPVFSPEARRRVSTAGRGLAASPGAASGRVVLSAEEAVAQVQKGESVILVREETSPDDIRGMAAAAGMLTAAGGMTSHAAVVGRQMGKPAVVGCEALRIDPVARTIRVGGITVAAGDFLSIDGTTGDVIAGKLETIASDVVRAAEGKRSAPKSSLVDAFERLLEWADLVRRLRVRANADSGKDARVAVRFGAEGIGLCRTEHMFFGKDRIAKMRAMILARTEKERAKALGQLLVLQRKDFVDLFRAMDGLPVTVRTLDPPLHEFLPNESDLRVQIEVMRATGKTRGKNAAKLRELELLHERVKELAEFNPMLGWRGCRLTIVHPEIVEMQARAILEAAALCIAQGIDVQPEIMVPLVGQHEELQNQRERIERTAEQVMSERNVRIPFRVGTMIEVPRGALTADEIAKSADFFSFGTNDLTQTALGFSRDDTGKFLDYYLEHGILHRNPFVSIDREGVGQLMRIGVDKGRRTKQGLKIGICGEHGGDPQSIGFCHDLGLDYVSCSPYRIPVARLAAAQAVLHERGVEAVIARARRNRRAKLPPQYHEQHP
jgi:pyruvate,orthophosphate dikinase